MALCFGVYFCKAFWGDLFEYNFAPYFIGDFLTLLVLSFIVFERWYSLSFSDSVPIRRECHAKGHISAKTRLTKGSIIGPVVQQVYCPYKFI